MGDEFAQLLAELENVGGDIDAVDVTTIRPAELPTAPAVIVSTAPLDGPADAEVIASENDGAVLLLTPRGHLGRAVRSLRQLDVRIDGAVLEVRAR